MFGITKNIQQVGGDLKWVFTVDRAKSIFLQRLKFPALIFKTQYSLNKLVIVFINVSPKWW